MNRVAASLLLGFAACVDAAGTGDGELDTDYATQGVTVPRMFGMDVSWLTGAEYPEAIARARTTGITFVQQSIDWTMLEAGPDDTLAHSAIDTKKWDVAGPFTADVAAGVVRYQAPAASAGGALAARYKLGSGVISAEVNATLVSSGGTQAMLLLRFGPNDTAGGRCSNPSDAFVALMMTHVSGAPMLIAASCRNGVPRTDGLIPLYPATAKLRISRGANSLVIRSATNTVATLTLSTLPAAFAGPARISVFAANPQGPAHVTLSGVRVTGAVAWDHPTDRFVGDPAFDVPAALEYTHRPLHTPLVVSLRTIDTVSAHLPSDLVATDPTTGRVDLSRSEVRQRYKEAVDYLVSQMPNVPIAGFSVGNEVDVYMNGPTSWAQTTAFANDVIPYVKSKLAAGNPVGITITSNGLLTHPAEVAALQSEANAVFLTYYPLDATFAARDPMVVPGDLAAFLAATPKPLLFIEAGYPSAGPSLSCLTCTGSTARQAGFFHQMFAGWDAHPDRILGFSVSWMRDMPASELATWTAYYGISSPNFVAYLASLGVRTTNNEPKPAWATLVNDAHARGF